MRFLRDKRLLSLATMLPNLSSGLLHSSWTATEFRVLEESTFRFVRVSAFRSCDCEMICAPKPCGHSASLMTFAACPAWREFRPGCWPRICAVKLVRCLNTPSPMMSNEDESVCQSIAYLVIIIKNSSRRAKRMVSRFSLDCYP